MMAAEGKVGTAKRVAVIGSGPAGMHAALLLAKAGFAVEIFEKEPLPGGMLQYYLPKFRFSREGIKQKIAQLEKLGVKLHLGICIGKERPLQKIIENFDAVVIATGEWKAKKLGIEGEDLNGVQYWTEFLRQYNEGKVASMGGKHVAVIGAGDTAMDCTRVALRLNAKVSLFYRRSREEMPAIKHEAEAAEREGVKFNFLLSPVKFLGIGGLEAVVFEKMESGERKELKGTGKMVEVKADAAIIAIGQQLDLSILEGSPYKSFEELPEKAVLAGDIVNEKKLIVTAIKSAIAAAEKIKKYVDN